MILSCFRPFMGLCLVFTLTTCSGDVSSMHWQHFDDQVFERAKKENKPVILHLAANWCHWCHVMEEETYANPKIVEYLESNFIVCKEDHDERRDLTSRYREYGWPATIIFSPDGKEIFKEAGYIEYNEFLKILKKIKRNPDQVLIPADNKGTDAKLLPMGDQLAELSRQYRKSLDVTLGGFTSMMKYINFDAFEYALNHGNNDDTLSRWLSNSMKFSAGLYDEAWGGMYQYSTHGDWENAHYEKLLSIQARYMKMYSWYYKKTGDASVLKRARGIAAYVQRFFKTPEGGFYNAQDADRVKGVKAHAYFALDDAGRVEQGIPAIDSSIYTDENSMLAESLYILWSVTGDDSYKNNADGIIDWLMKNRKGSNGMYYHGKTDVGTFSLSDNIWMARALLMAYRVGSDKKILNEGMRVMRQVADRFYDTAGWYRSYGGKSALPPPFVFAENLEAGRLMNLYFRLSGEEIFRKQSEAVHTYLFSPEIFKTIWNEAGLIGFHEEMMNDPYKGVYFIYPGQVVNTDIVRELVAIPRFYLLSMCYDEKSVTADKKELMQSFDRNVLFFCTNTFCSAPMESVGDIRTFLTGIK